MYMSQTVQVTITIEGPRQGINLGISSPQREHANHYTNADRQMPLMLVTNRYVDVPSTLVGFSLFNNLHHL